MRESDRFLHLVVCKNRGNGGSVARTCEKSQTRFVCLSWKLVDGCAMYGKATGSLCIFADQHEPNLRNKIRCRHWGFTVIALTCLCGGDGGAPSPRQGRGGRPDRCRKRGRRGRRRLTCAARVAERRLQGDGRRNPRGSVSFVLPGQNIRQPQEV